MLPPRQSRYPAIDKLPSRATGEPAPLRTAALLRAETSHGMTIDPTGTIPRLPEIPGYRVLRRLGRGGMADIFLAVQQSLQREVALKVLTFDAAVTDEQVKRFEREARTIARLEHPHIVGIFDVGRIGEQCLYFAMPHLPGGDLSKRDLRESPREALRVLRAIAEALQYAHAQGVVHRDVKPENILFDKADRPLLADFGIALSRHESHRMTNEGRTIGSSGYMSPEQARGLEIDGRADLYSLGVVCYEMLTGELPYRGSDSLSMALAHAQDPVPRLPARWRDWQGFVDTALAKVPEQRFQTAREMLDALEQVEHGRFVSKVPSQITGESAASKIVPLGPIRARPWFWMAAGATLVFALAVHGGTRWLFGRSGDGERAPSAAGTPPTLQVPEAARLDALLAEGGALLQKGTLVEPEASAATKFLEALALAPDLPEARAGLDAAMEAAAKRAEAAIAGRRGDEAATLYQKAHAIAERSRIPDYPAWADFDNRFAEATRRALAEANTRLDGDLRDALAPAVEYAATQHADVAEEQARAASIPQAGARLRDPSGPRLTFVPPGGGVERGFAAGVYEVTRGDYSAFARATGREPGRCRDGSNPIAMLSRRDWRDPGYTQTDAEPAVCVPWHDARAYAEWLSKRTGATYRLPTRSEWQRLAQATATSGSACKLGNLLDRNERGRSGDRHDCRDGFERTAPVGRHAAGGYGAADLVGNAREWLADCTRSSNGGECGQRAVAGSSFRDGARKPLLPVDGSRDPELGAPDLGFRLVREIQPGRMPPAE
jgi:hypothetical protein